MKSEKPSSYKEFMLRHGINCDSLDENTKDEVDAIYISVFCPDNKKVRIPAQMSETAVRFLNNSVREMRSNYIDAKIEISRLHLKIRKIREELETISRYFPDFVVPDDFGE